MAYVNDSDEEQEEEEDMLLACIIVSEHLEEKEEKGQILCQGKDCLGTSHCRVNKGR